MIEYQILARRAMQELRSAVLGVDPAALALLATDLAAARRIVAHGAGREGLMMRALAMRLYHLGLNVQMQGDMSCPPVGRGDLLIVSAGPGDLSTVAALVVLAKHAGARVACVTAQPQGGVPRSCDLVLVIPAQTMANNQSADLTSVLPMGSVFEAAQFLVFEMLILLLRDRLDISAEAMRARHTNLE